MEYRMRLATEADKEEVLSLYKANLFGPADWNEHYPNEDTFKFDVERDSLFVMQNGEEIIGAISIDSDKEVEELKCWNKELQPSGELSRVCVKAGYRGKGLAKELMRHCFGVLKTRGCKSVHILVKIGHVAALKSYSDLGFVKVGECRLFEKDFICMEIEI